jgi:hypothetical protein
VTIRESDREAVIDGRPLRVFFDVLLAGDAGLAGTFELTTVAQKEGG